MKWRSERWATVCDSVCLLFLLFVHTSLFTYSHFFIFIYSFFVNSLAAVTRSIIVTIFLVCIFQYVKGISGL